MTLLTYYKFVLLYQKVTCFFVIFMLNFLSLLVGSLHHFTTLSVIDGFNRQALNIDIDVSLPVGRIIHYQDKLAQYHGYLLKIWINNGLEFTG